MSSKFWVKRDAAVEGPFEVELLAYLRGFGRETLVSPDAFSEDRWGRAAEWPDLTPLFPPDAGVAAAPQPVKAPPLPPQGMDDIIFGKSNPPAPPPPPPVSSPPPPKKTPHLDSVRRAIEKGQESVFDGVPEVLRDTSLPGPQFPKAVPGAEADAARPEIAPPSQAGSPPLRRARTDAEMEEILRLMENIAKETSPKSSSTQAPRFPDRPSVPAARQEPAKPAAVAAKPGKGPFRKLWIAVVAAALAAGTAATVLWFRMQWTEAENPRPSQTAGTDAPFPSEPAPAVPARADPIPPQKPVPPAPKSTPAKPAAAVPAQTKKEPARAAKAPSRPLKSQKFLLPGVPSPNVSASKIPREEAPQPPTQETETKNGKDDDDLMKPLTPDPEREYKNMEWLNQDQWGR